MRKLAVLILFISLLVLAACDTATSPLSPPTLTPITAPGAFDFKLASDGGMLVNSRDLWAGPIPNMTYDQVTCTTLTTLHYRHITEIKPVPVGVPDGVVDAEGHWVKAQFDSTGNGTYSVKSIVYPVCFFDATPIVDPS